MPHRILLVEDNSASLELMRYLLQSAGYETFQATNGEQAALYLSSSLPDLILTDIQMPGWDGYELLAHIRSDVRLRKLTVVALTAYSMSGDQDRIMRAGFDGYMAKPIDPETILMEVERFLCLGHAGPRPQ